MSIEIQILLYDFEKIDILPKLLKTDQDFKKKVNVEKICMYSVINNNYIFSFLKF